MVLDIFKMYFSPFFSIEFKQHIFFFEKWTHLSHKEQKRMAYFQANV